MSEDRPQQPATPPDTSKDQRPRATPQPGTRPGRPTGDGRRDAGQHKRNQEHLGVGSDHRTESMKKHRRGTFP
jgi:hypothetical protein